MSEVTLYPLSGDWVQFDLKELLGRSQGPTVQRYLAHKKTLTLLGPPSDPRHRPTVGS